MAARTAPPRIRGLVVRRRLFGRLDARQPLVWVGGPPGAGKTTLVASYLTARRLRARWYRLDAEDADGAFLRDVGRDAVRSHARGDALYARLLPPFVVVLDDYQTVPPDAPLHEMVCRAVERLPPRGRIVVLSRMAPPPAFARLRAGRAIAEIGWADLRLTPSETRRLARRIDRSRPGDRIAALHALTEGWVAGLVLALQDRRNLAHERRGVPDAIADYFEAEVFGRLDPDTQDILLRTAFLPLFTSAMAEALTGHDRASRVLVELHRGNCFITQHADPEAVWQYSPLFRGFLLRVAYTVFPPAQRREIQRQAARLLSAAGHVDAAVTLLRAASDWDAMAAIVEAHAPALAATGHVRLVGGWLASIPDELVGRHAWLLYWRGLCRMQSDPVAARDDLLRALDGACAVGDAAGAFLAWAAAVRTFLLEHEDYRPLDVLIERFEALHQRFPQFPSREVEARAVTSVLVALLYRQPHRPEIRVWAHRALELGRGAPGPALQLAIMSAVLTYQTWTGDFEGAQASAADLRALAVRSDLPALERISALLGIARLHWLTGTFVNARDCIDVALELARASAVDVFTHRLLAEAAQAALSEGNRSAARRWLVELRRDVPRLRRGDRLSYHCLAGWDALLAGDVTAAVGAHELAVTESWELGMPTGQVLAHVFAALTLDAAGTPGASVHLVPAATVAHGMNSAIATFTVRLAEAHIAVSRGDEGRALQVLAGLLPIGRAHSFVNTWTWSATMMAELAARALDADLEVPYVRRLVRERRLIPREPPVHLETWPWPVKVFTLGRFEVLTDDRPVRFLGKAQKKPIALLQALVALGGRDVAEDQLAELLWPDSDGDAAHRALAVTLHRLRRLLGHGTISRSDGRIGLAASHCWVDVWALEGTLARAEAAVARSPVRDHEWAASIRWTDRAVGLYRGGVLMAEPALPAAARVTARLKERLLRQLRRIARVWEGLADWEAAAECYERAVTIDECAEDAYRRLIAAYRRLDRRGDAMLAYQRCRKALAGLGVAPSPETEASVRGL